MHPDTPPKPSRNEDDDNPAGVKPLGTVADPQAVIRQMLQGNAGGAISFNFEFSPYYLPDPQSLSLFAECKIERGELHCRIGPAPDLSGAAWINLCQPLRLDPVTVAKPWGEEIWYTGIEARGVCSVKSTPLPWLIALSPERLLGIDGIDPVLLKILAPLAEADYGDLYLELHEEKIEVYIVTGIDPTAWPDGQGRIRYGFNPTKLAEYEDADAFRTAYLQAVTAYREIRLQIDEHLDQCRAAAGIAPDAVVSPAQQDIWRTSLDPALRQVEAQRRDAMYVFTALRPLVVGSLVQVAPLTPHSLQHGVRVIEFQSPHYERFILSFGQKVLTQSHWDTETALARARLTADMTPTVTPVIRQPGCQVDQIVRFPEFEVLRIQLAPGASYRPELAHYGVYMGVDGKILVGRKQLSGEQAALVPAMAGAMAVTNNGATDALVLLARPCQASSEA